MFKTNFEPKLYTKVVPKIEKNCLSKLKNKLLKKKMIKLKFNT